MPRPKVRVSWGGMGKAPPEVMEDAVYANLGKDRDSVLVGPARGLDNAVLALPGGRVMILTTDPVSMIPAIGPRMSAWLSVHLIASDLTTSGVDPEFATFSFNFPRGMSASERGAYIHSIGEECGRLGVAVVAGNTGTYPGSGFTVIGAGTMFGTAPGGKFVTPAMAEVGDRVVVTKSAAIEATVSLAHSFPGALARRHGAGVAKKARGMLRLCSTVKDARAARRVGLGRGGVTSMHDATEGGVLGALDEMASASRKKFVVDPLEVPVSHEAESVCAAFGLDPLRTMGEGALLVTCSPDVVRPLRRELSGGGIPSREIGVVEEGRGLLLSARHGPPARFRPAQDRYWRAYDRALGEGLA